MFGVRRNLLLWLLVGGAALACKVAAQHGAHRVTAPQDWPQFGYDVASSGNGGAATGITAANVASLTRRQVRLDGTVDSSAVYLHDVAAGGVTRDVFFVTTTYGKTIAVDAGSGAIVWEYTPQAYSSWVGTAQFTNSAPAADPDRAHIYAAAPDGSVQKLAVADGSLVWKTAVTLLPSREKLTSAVKVYRGRVIAVTGGYIGDAPPYQGHVAVLDAQTGALQHVWNSLCSDRAGLIQPSSCASTKSAIWGRAGAVIDRATGNIFVATGNGPYNGMTDWGDALIELSPDATSIVANYTPSDNASLEARDLDLGSTSPVLLGGGLVLQSGKDSVIRLLRLDAIAGAASHVGDPLQTIPTPSRGMVFNSQAVWQDRGATWMFAADGGGTAAWTVVNGALALQWSHPTGGSSPIVAGGLLYVYDPAGALHVYDPRSGVQRASLPCGAGHWNSPIVVDGRIALPEGNANQHATSGVLDIWSNAP